MIGLEFIRKLCNKQIKDVAEAIGVSRQAVSSWEKGIRPIPAQRIDSLLEYFSIAELSKDDLQNDVDTSAEIKLRGLYTRSTIQDESLSMREKIDLDMKALIQQMESTILVIPRKYKFDFESDLYSAMDRRIKLINNFLLLLNQDCVPSRVLFDILDGIELGMQDSEIEVDGSLKHSIAKTLSLWQEYNAKEIKFIADMKKELAEYDDLY